jgi:PKD repeat protein
MKIFAARLALVTIFTVLFACGGNDPEPSNPTDPKACFAEVPTVEAGTAIQFSSACSANATTYQWDFGGLASSAQANPSYTFENAGTYIVKLTVSNGTKTATTQRSVTIDPAPAPVCTVTHQNRDVTASETWKTGETHCIYGFFQIMDGAILTIEPGVTIKLAKNAGIYVVGDGAAVIAEGTEAQPILFTSGETNKQVGDWVALEFQSDHPEPSSLKYCTFEYGGSEVFASFDTKVGMVGVEGDTTVSIDHCTFRKSLSHAVELDSYAELANFTNNHISEAGDYAIYAQTQNVHSIGEGNIIDNKGIWIQSEWFNKSVTWLKHTVPYYTNGIDVGSNDGVTLTISPGVTIYFEGGPVTTLNVGYWGEIGKLIAVGTPTEKITFTSAAPNPAPGDWGGFIFGTGTQSGTVLDNVVIEYASGNDTEYAALDVNTNGLQLKNSFIRNIQGIAIHLDIERSRRFAAFTNNVIEAPSTAYAIKMTTIGVESMGEGNTISGKSIYLLSDSFRSDVNVLCRNYDIPYIVDGNVMLGSATLADYTFTIEAGCVLKFTPNAGMTIASSEHVKFIAVGTAEKPIVFTSASETPAPGDWDGIEFYNRLTTGSIMDHCIVEYGGGRFANITSWTLPTADLLTITNCEMNYSAEYGFYSWMSNTTMANNAYTGNVMGETKVE